MNSPLVSRTRFEDLQKRCAQLESEKRELSDDNRNLRTQVLELTRQVAELAAKPPAAQETEDGEPERPKGRVSIADVRSMADAAAQKAFKGRTSLWSSSPRVANGN